MKHRNIRPADKQGNEKYGLVLGGGGSKGCYHVGVWQAFNEAGIEFDALTGTSIGALVGIFYPGNRIETVTDFVMNMQPGAIAQDLPPLPVTLKEKVKGTRTVLHFLIRYFDSRMDIRPLREHFRAMFDYEIFHDSPVRYACMTFNDTKQEPRPFYKSEIREDNAEQIVMASSACYPAFPKVDIGGELYTDGMYADNVPIELLKSILPNAAWTVVVDLHEPGEPKPPALDSSMFYLEPLLHPGNALDFTTPLASRLYAQGYLETRKQLGSLTGYLYTFDNSDLPLMQIVESYLIRQTSQMSIVFPKAERLDLASLRAALGYMPGYLPAADDPGYEFGRYVEALALMAKIDPVALYSYPDYLRKIVASLAGREQVPETDEYRFVEMIAKVKREEIMHILHRQFVKNHGRLPEKLESFKEQMPVSYTLAWIWYCLDTLIEQLDEGHENRTDSEADKKEEQDHEEMDGYESMQENAQQLETASMTTDPDSKGEILPALPEEALPELPEMSGQTQLKA